MRTREIEMWCMANQSAETPSATGKDGMPCANLGIMSVCPSPRWTCALCQVLQQTLNKYVVGAGGKPDPVCEPEGCAFDDGLLACQVCCR